LIYFQRVFDFNIFKILKYLDKKERDN